MSKTWLILVLSMCLGVASAQTPQPATVAPQSEAELLVTRGLALFDANLYEDAARLFQQAAKKQPTLAEARYHLGNAYLRLKQNDKALAAYGQAIKLNLKMPMVYNNMALAQKSLGEPEKALASLKQALAIDSQFALGYLNLGVLQAEQGDKKAALEQYERLKTLDAELAAQLYDKISPASATVRQSTGEVRLNVTVTDVAGNLVTNLQPADFRVAENDVPQTLELVTVQPLALYYGLVVDNSGSFKNSLPLAVGFAQTLVESNDAADEGFVSRYVDSDIIERMTDFTTDRKRLKTALADLYIESGQTALIDAVYLGTQHLAGYQPRKPYRRRVLLLFSDGEERNSFYRVEELLPVLRVSDVQVFAVALQRTSDKASKLNRDVKAKERALLEQIATTTGGQVFYPQTVEELPALVGQITARLRGQYLMSYKSSVPKSDTGPHKISVTITPAPGRENLKISVRPAYQWPE